jgi:hypothetical protein
VQYSCCNYLYGEGIKQLIEQNGLDIDTAINSSVPEEIIETKPDVTEKTDPNFRL